MFDTVLADTALEKILEFCSLTLFKFQQKKIKHVPEFRTVRLFLTTR